MRCRLGCAPVNFATDVLEAAPAGERALVEIAREGARAGMAVRRGRRRARAAWPRALHAEGVGRGDVVLTLVGNRPEWVLAMVACFRLGRSRCPCTEQLRAKDLELRLRVAQPRLIVCDERNAEVLERPAGPGRRCWVPWGELPDAPARASRRPRSRRPVPDHVHVRHRRASRRRSLHGQRYLAGQMVQAEHWLDARAGRPRLVHRGVGLVEVGPQRVHRPVAARRRRAAARRALRPAGAPGAARPRARRRALHGADRVPRDRQANDDPAAGRPAWRGRRRRGAQPRGARRLARGDRASGSATATDRPRPASSPGMPLGDPGQARLDGRPAAGHAARRR